MECVGDGTGLLVHWTGVTATGLGGGLSGMLVAGKMVTLGVNSDGVSFGTLGEGAGQSIWSTPAGEGRCAIGIGAVGGLAVRVKKMRESVWIAAN